MFRKETRQFITKEVKALSFIVSCQGVELLADRIYNSIAKSTIVLPKSKRAIGNGVMICFWWPTFAGWGRHATPDAIYRRVQVSVLNF